MSISDPATLPYQEEEKKSNSVPSDPAFTHLIG